MHIVHVSSLQVENITKFIEMHREIVEALSLHLEPISLKKLKKIGEELSDDLFDIYKRNEKKLQDIICNARSKVSNIKQAHNQIEILKRIPFIEKRTNITYN